MRLERQYGADRLEAACAGALSIRPPTYTRIKSILAAGLGRRSLEAAAAARLCRCTTTCVERATTTEESTKPKPKVNSASMQDGGNCASRTATAASPGA